MPVKQLLLPKGCDLKKKHTCFSFPLSRPDIRYGRRLMTTETDVAAWNVSGGSGREQPGDDFLCRDER